VAAELADTDTTAAPLANQVIASWVDKVEIRGLCLLKQKQIVK
jgi:hypothetical protein